MQVTERSTVLFSRLRLLHHFQDLIRRSHPRHAREDRVHESRQGVLVRVAARVANDDDVVVVVARRIDRGSDADVDRAAGNDDRVDAAGAQRQV